jgi:hypothetical protein
MHHLPVLTILQCARAGRVREMAVALSDAAGIPLEVMDRFLDGSSDDPTMLLCKAIDLDWVTAYAVLCAKRGDAAMNEDQADAAQRRYRNLSVYAAQRVVRFWQAREKLSKAG